MQKLTKAPTHARALPQPPTRASTPMIFVLLFMQYKVHIAQYKSLITFFRGVGVKASPRTALLLSKILTLNGFCDLRSLKDFSMHPEVNLSNIT
jgi:hypothetical protein